MENVITYERSKVCVPTSCTTFQKRMRVPYLTVHDPIDRDRVHLEQFPSKPIGINCGPAIIHFPWIRTSYITKDVLDLDRERKERETRKSRCLTVAGHRNWTLTFFFFFSSGGTIPPVRLRIVVPELPRSKFAFAVIGSGFDVTRRTVITVWLFVLATI